MQIRHVKWVGGGLRGLGLGFSLRFFAQGSARGRRFLVTLVGRASAAVCLVWERRTLLFVESGVAVIALAGAVRMVGCCD
jgi:hypothetical protein